MVVPGSLSRLFSQRVDEQQPQPLQLQLQPRGRRQSRANPLARERRPRSQPPSTFVGPLFWVLWVGWHFSRRTPDAAVQPALPRRPIAASLIAPPAELFTQVCVSIRRREGGIQKKDAQLGGR